MKTKMQFELTWEEVERALLVYVIEKSRLTEGCDKYKVEFASGEYVNDAFMDEVDSCILTIEVNK